MAKRREKLQVIYDILKVIYEKNAKARPTYILYKSNLSHQMMNEYLKELIEKGFIIEVKAKEKTYSLTKKGEDYINQFKVITEFMDSFGL